MSNNETNEGHSPQATESAGGVKETREPRYKRGSDYDEDEDKGYRGKDGEKNPRKNPKYKRKVCRLCTDKSILESVDYKKPEVLERFITNRGKILPRRITGSCAKHQRLLVREIKKARSICLLPYKVM